MSTFTIKTEERAVALAESFINGNRAYVVREIVTEEAPLAALLAASVFFALSEREGVFKANGFLIALERWADQ